MRRLYIFDCSLMVFGIVVGSGILFVPSVVAELSVNTLSFVFTWFFGGMLSLVGSLCISKSVCKNQECSSFLMYLNNSFSKKMAVTFFLFIVFIINSSSIAIVSSVFCDHLTEVIDAISREEAKILVIVFLCFLNSYSVKSFFLMNYFVNIIKVCIYMGLIAGGIALWNDDQLDTQLLIQEDLIIDSSGLVYVLWAYAGWFRLPFVMRFTGSPEKTIKTSLFLTMSFITFVYVLINILFISTLGQEHLSNSSTPGLTFIEVLFGRSGKYVFFIFLSFFLLGTLNNLLTTSGMLLSDFFINSTRFNLFDSVRVGLIVQALIVILFILFIDVSFLLSISVGASWFLIYAICLSGLSNSFKEKNIFSFILLFCYSLIALGISILAFK